MRDFLEFFGLKDDPFKITLDSKYFFLSESHQEALMSLKYLLDTEEGFAVIVGEPGTGKTLTVRKFLDEVGEEVRYAYILFPNLSPSELFEAILEDFGIKGVDGNKNKLFAKLRDVLIESRKAGKKVLIIVDEAQNLPIETLEELRILSNLETEDFKLIQIILLGQPELEDMLDMKELRQLKQRITVFSRLRNLSPEEVEAYINLRISKAGGGNLKVSKKAYKAVYEASLGIPRLINVIMERALMAAFVDASHEIKSQHIKRAAQSVGVLVDKSSTASSSVRKLAAGVLIGVVIALILSLGLIFHFHFGPLTDKASDTAKAKTSMTKEVRATKPPKKQRWAVVSVPMLNMREKPDRNSDVVFLLKEGNRLKVLDGGEGVWVKVAYEEGGSKVEGWVNRKYIRFVDWR